MFADSRKSRTFAPQLREKSSKKTKDGPFVYRLGRKIFILERGVRFPHGLPRKRVIQLNDSFFISFQLHESLSLSILAPAMNEYILLTYNPFQVKEGIPHIDHHKPLILKPVKHKKTGLFLSKR